MSVLSAPPPQTQIFPALTRDAVAPLGYQAGDFTYGVPAVWRWGEPATLVIGKFCSLSTEIVIFPFSAKISTRISGLWGRRCRGAHQ